MLQGCIWLFISTDSKCRLLIVWVRWGSTPLVMRLKIILFYKTVLRDSRVAVVE